ncbi:MAG TPA: PH domain-containing protein [Chloroflexota bacterium]
MFRPYRETLLAEAEPVALVTRPHVFTFWRQAIGAFLLALVLIAAAVLVEQVVVLPPNLANARPYLTLVLLGLAVIGVLLVLKAWIDYRSKEIVVTDRRVLRIAGVLSKHVIDNGLDAITDLQLRQSWFGRIFDYGDVDILTASEASHNTEDTFPDVSGPIAFMHAVQEQRERRRMRPWSGPSVPQAPQAPPAPGG